jgi:uncharacterized repeat protein (TIGR01451 family)
MGTRTNRRSASRRKTVAFVVGFFLTLAFGLGQSATVFAAGAGGGSSVGASGGGSTRPDPTSAKATDSKSGSTVGTSANAAPSGGLTGGDVSLDYVAAGPGTYNHDTGVGGAYANRTIDKNTGVVESLEGGDFACGDLVVFFTQVVIDAGASGSGAVQLDYQWDGNTTGQPGIGFVDLVSASSNSPDSGSTANGNESVSILSESDTPNVNASIQITNLDPGEHFILRTVVRLGCQVGAHPTGNILTAIKDASVVGDGRISVGNQTVPLKKVEDIAQPGISVQKTCPQSGSIGDTITYSITVTNTGNEELTNLVVNDPLLGGNLGKFPSGLAAGASDTETFTHTITANDPDPLTNSVTATAVGATSGATVSDQDSCDTDILHQPGISVQKTCPAGGHVGDTITYSITVTNTGNERLDDLVVTDALLGGTLSSFPTSLAVGGSSTRTFTYTLTANDPDPLTNSVTASGTGADSGTQVSDTDSCQTDVLHTAGIDVSKTCPEGGNIGDTITYSITVTNTGDEALTDVVVNDPLLGGDLAGFPSTLAVGASVTKTFTHTITADDPDPLTNTVTASGTGADSQASVQDTDSCGTDVHHQPGISVQKTCPEAASIGDTITYSITVTNTGNEALTGVVVVDELLGGALGSFPDTLAVGDSATRTFTYTVTADDPDPLTNTVTASGTGADSDQTVSDQAECSTDVVHPTIDLVKDGPALAHVGDTITYTFTVTNPGDVDLFDVTLSDPICDPGTLHFVGGDTQGAVRLGAVGGDGILSPGEVWTYECTHVVTAEDPDPLPNTATVTAIDSQENQVSDQASHVVDIIHPAIKIVKTANPTSGSPGDTITYTYDVTNTGDTTLFDVSVDDDVMGHIGDIAELAVGETVTLTAEFTLGNSPVTNVGTAAGHDVLGLEVTDDDDATVAVVAPVIENNPKTPRPTAFTGFDDRGLTGIAIALMLLGLAAALIGRRRRGLET